MLIVLRVNKHFQIRCNLLRRELVEIIPRVISLQPLKHHSPSNRNRELEFLNNALQVESHFHKYLHDNLNAGVVNEEIKSIQEAVDYLSQTYMYQRLHFNPSFYKFCGGRANESRFLSELIEKTLEDLRSSKLNWSGSIQYSDLAWLASYCYISFSTAELFRSSLKERTKLEDLLDILTEAAEFEEVPVRPGEAELIKKLMKNHPNIFSSCSPNYMDSHVKANALLQAHYHCLPVEKELAEDQRKVIVSACRLLEAMVYITSIMRPMRMLGIASLAIDMSQEITQGLQAIPDSVKQDVSLTCSAPNQTLLSDEPVRVKVSVKRDVKGGNEHAGWWIVLAYNNEVVAVKKVALHGEEVEAELAFKAPSTCGMWRYYVLLKSDSHSGCDKASQFTIDVGVSSWDGDQVNLLVSSLTKI